MATQDDAHETNTKREKYQKLLGALSEQLHRVDNGMPRSIMHQLDKLATDVDSWLSHSETRSKQKHKKQKVKKFGTSNLIVKAVFAFVVDFARKLDGEQKFFDQYIRDGHMGFLRFRAKIENLAKEVIALEDLPPQEKESVLEHVQKKNGLIDSMIVNMHEQVWTSTERFLKETNVVEWEALAGNPGIHPKNIALLKEWSSLFLHARGDGVIRVAGETSIEEQVQFWNTKKIVRPSRAIYGQRMLAFIEMAQLHVTSAKSIGEGIEGKVGLCTVSNVPFIPSTATLCFKEFTSKKISENRKSAMTEATLGGVNHKGIVAALAMTTIDPPLLVFDYYNGGTIDKMTEKVRRSAWPNVGRLQEISRPMDCKEIVAFMNARLGICFAILETIDFLHQNSRLHNDLHAANVMLHFDYDVDRNRDDALITKASVGIIDWGQALYFSQLRKAPRLCPTKDADKAQAMLDYPHIAPELLCESPPAFSIATEMYAIGNLIETILLNQGGWERGRLDERILWERWEKAFYPRLMVMVTTMKSDRPSSRKDCGHWKSWMITNFPGCGLYFGSAQFLRE